MKIRADLFGEEKTRCHYEERGSVALLTLEDEGLNGYSYKMFRDLDDAVLRARFNPEIEAIVITGAGEHFCAGANIKMLEAADPTSKYYFCLHANETLLRLEHTPKLVIAAIPGHCVGGGYEIALACDLRVARRAGGRRRRGRRRDVFVMIAETFSRYRTRTYRSLVTFIRNTSSYKEHRTYSRRRVSLTRKRLRRRARVERRSETVTRARRAPT